MRRKGRRWAKLLVSNGGRGSSESSGGASKDGRLCDVRKEMRNLVEKLYLRTDERETGSSKGKTLARTSWVFFFQFCFLKIHLKVAVVGPS